MSSSGPSPSSSATNATNIRSTSPLDKVGSAILANSNSGWSPLRINKSSDGLAKPAGNKIVHPPVRRTSSSFRHVHNNNLVSNSPFKLASPNTLSSGLPPKVPSKIPTPATRRVSGERRASFERRKKAILLEGENTRPDGSERVSTVHRRQTKGLTTLERAEYVSKSPFRNSVSEPVFSSSSERSVECDDIEPATKDLDDVLNTTGPPGAHVTDNKPVPYFPPDLGNLSSSLPVPSEVAVPRSNLVSRRLHGPRSTSGSTRRSRSKTVTFDERCDVVEFDVMSFEEEVFQSDYEVDYDPNGPRHMQEGDGYDSNPSDHDDSYMSDPEGDRGFVSSSLGQGDHGMYSDRSSRSSMSPRPSTPPGRSTVLPNDDAEDGVPYGRSHHIDRLKAAHSSSPAGPPLTPIRDGAFDDRPTSPSPARALPSPPTSLTEVTDEIEGSQGLGRQRAPLVPLTLSPSKGRPVEPATTNDPFVLPPEHPTANSSQYIAQHPADELRRSESPAQRGNALNSSSGSVESSGSFNRSSPRITRDEVRKRLLRSRTHPIDGEDIRGSGDEHEESSRYSTPTRQTDELTAGPSSVHPRPRSVDLHQPGVDLGDVRSALDRLMIGVERGFTDDVSSIGGSRDVSFADDTANSSLAADNSGQNNEEHSVIISSHISQVPAISPPSPLLSASKQMSAPSETDSSAPEHKRASSEASTTTTEGTDEETGPRTPSESVVSPAIAIQSHSIAPSGMQSPSTQRGKYTGLEFEARAPDKNKALPATPHPRISLDLPLTSTFNESEFGDFTSGLTSSDGSPDRSIPAIEVMRVEPSQRASKPPLSGKEAIKAHEDAIIARRRALRREEYGNDGPQERPQRRRSRSTGDALDVRTEVIQA